MADEDLDVVVPELGGSSSLRPPATIKEGQELGYPSEPVSLKGAGAAAVGLAAEDDQEDMATVKRRAQVRRDGWVSACCHTEVLKKGQH